MSIAVDVIAEPERAQALLHPARLELLEALEEPGSAAALARRLGLPRQRVNYHLRELEAQRLVELVEERSRGSCRERVYRRTGRTYAISSTVLGELGIRPEEVRDRFSSAYQIALAARTVRELGALQVGARAARKALPTFALEADVRFRSPADRHAFAEELSAAVAELVARYHAPDEPGGDAGRVYRFHLGGYPRPKEEGG